MHRCLPFLRQLALTTAVTVTACLPSMASAAPITYDAFLDGSGFSVFTVADPATGNGSGAWTGTLADAPFPVPDRPLSLLTQVNFSFDAMRNLLTGDFAFTDAGDFASTITGLLSGSFEDGGFDAGGQLFVNYDIRGGTGGFGGATGFLISLVDITAPDIDGFASYTEAATGQFMVPEPGTLPLLAGALLVMGLLQRRRAPR